MFHKDEMAKYRQREREEGRKRESMLQKDKKYVTKKYVTKKYVTKG